MKVVVVYDNEALMGYKAGWGFSCYVKAKEKILFDAGWDGNILLHNLKKAEIEDFDYIMLSHAHWDHIGGLNHVINKTNYVIVPKSFSKNLKREISKRSELIEVNNPIEIAEGFYTTGDLNGEQSAILKSKKGLVVITGCAHPGLDKILSKAREFGKIFAVLGGFHGFSKIEELSNYLTIPCHCTSKKDEILKFKNSRICAAGSIFKL
ncbi:MBL fold hydrolase [Archaeoglobales archaeon]|nr:MAG: MBL fold hydrolase [Archaeoglobales archaeon]